MKITIHLKDDKLELPLENFRESPKIELNKSGVHLYCNISKTKLLLSILDSIFWRSK